nr:unnamed protein product [Callosobruchus analis]
MRNYGVQQVLPQDRTHCRTLRVWTMCLPMIPLISKFLFSLCLL